MARITVEVEAEIDVSDIDTLVLAKSLIKKRDWDKALQMAISKTDCKHMPEENDLHQELRTMIDQYKMGKDIAPFISKIAYQEFGMVVH